MFAYALDGHPITVRAAVAHSYFQSVPMERRRRAAYPAVRLAKGWNVSR